MTATRTSRQRGGETIIARVADNAVATFNFEFRMESLRPKYNTIISRQEDGAWTLD
jgi:hypothetical protein